MKFYLTIFLTTVYLALVKAQTGIPVPGMTSCDASVQNFMSTYNIPGLSFGLAKDGRLVYHRAFGTANQSGTEQTYPHHIFRIASLSKPLTGVAIMKLIEQGQLSLFSKPFGPGGILQAHPYLSNATITDNRIYNITVQQLLEHTAGWNRTTNCFPNPTSPYTNYFQGCDPIVAPLHVTQQVGASNPVNEENMIFFLLEKGLDFTPGTQYQYSNIGYLVLGEIIEAITNMSYENYLNTQLFNPIGACDFHIANNLQVNKIEREVDYIGPGSTLSCYGTGAYVPWQNGGLCVEAMTAHGGWITSTRDFLRLLVAVDNFPTKPDILSSSTINTMVTPSTVNPNYAKGWSVNGGNWFHNGSIDGTASFMMRTSTGYTVAIFMNGRSNNSNFWSALDQLPWNCISSAGVLPGHDLFVTPTVNVNNLSATQSSANSATINWNSGNGAGRVIIARKDLPVDKFPADGVNYSANSSFGSGTNLGNGNYMVYDGNSSTSLITNLTAGSTYYFRAFEYQQNGTTGNNKLYLHCDSDMTTYSNSCPNVLNLPTVSEPQYSAKVEITTTASVSIPNVEFNAGNTIRLKPGFRSNSKEVRGKIQTCQ